jgi:putative ABC transport system permease protein
MRLRKRMLRDLDQDIRDHIARETKENVDRGMAPDEARYAALRKFGNVTHAKEDTREVWSLVWLGQLVRDIRFAARMLRKSPGFTAITILTLALGIGANAAIFSVLEAQLWRPLPFPDSERLVEAHLVLRERPRQWDVLPERIFRAWHKESISLTGLAGYLYPQNRNLTANGSSERVRVMAITSDLFDTVKLPPERGRSFLPEEETRGRDHVAILSHETWQNRFGSDPEQLGKSITIDGEAYIVVGVASSSVHFEYFGQEAAIYVPLSFGNSDVLRNLYTIARLAPGVPPEQARIELETILERELKSDPIHPEPTAVVANLRETWTSFSARPLYFFAGAVSLVFLIACVNAAGLLLARALTRRREFALRSALGASFATLIRQSLVESLMLSLAGSIAGTVLGIWLSQSLAAFIPGDVLPRSAAVAIDTRMLVFALGASIFSAIVVGVAPGIFAARVDSNRVLVQNARSFSPGLSQRRTHTSLVAIEVALGLVLLFGAGLFLLSFVRLQEAPRGFEAPGALTFHIALRGGDYAKPEQMQRYFTRLSEQLASMPGVREVTLGSGLPLTGSTDFFGTVNIAGRPPAHEFGTYETIHAVSPNYFQALHMRLLAGRTFDAHDEDGSSRVAILNRNAAEELFGAEDPLGKTLEFVAQPKRGVPAQPPVQIVGVVENAQEFGADEIPQMDLYVPFAQRPLPSAYFMVVSDLPRAGLADGIRAAAYNIDKNQPVYDLKTMDDRIKDSTRGARFNLFLVGGLAALAVTLVAIGIFGTVSYFVEQRTQEFGIRLALGASPAKLLRHAISQSLLTGGVGLALGITTSLALGRLLRHALYLAPHEHTGMLYGGSIYDPLSMSLACTVLLGAVVLASYIPARRAMRVDPMIALRHE